MNTRPQTTTNTQPETQPIDADPETLLSELARAVIRVDAARAALDEAQTRVAALVEKVKPFASLNPSPAQTRGIA